MRTPLRRSIAQVLKIGVADDLDEVAERGHDRGYLVYASPRSG
jgi:hypothetical protein